MNIASTRLARTTPGLTSGMQVARLLTNALIPLVALAAAAGLLFPAVYARNPATIIPALRGQDLVTLLALPALAVALGGAARGSPRGTLVYLGLLGYMSYTYTGAALGYAFAALTPLYILLFSLTAFALGAAIVGIDVNQLAQQVGPGVPRRVVAGFLVCIGLLLAGLELGQYGAYLASGVLPAGVAAAGGGAYFVYGLDLGLVLPLTLLGARWLWQRRPWGYLLAGATLIKAATMGAALLAMNMVSLSAGQPGDPAELLSFYTLLTLGGSGLSVWFFRHCAA